MRTLVKFRKVHPDAKVPTYATKGSAGFDFYACEDKFILPGNVEAVSTGLSVEIPEGFEIQVRPRSGLALKHSIGVKNSPGTVDMDFRGTICVIISNGGKSSFTVNKGDRIAQGVLAKVERAEFFEVEELSNTERGTGGFGSTGKS
jgi:dUTP pyrophosphatase